MGAAVSETTVLIVDDHAILRAGIRVLLELQPDLKVVGEARDAAEAVASCRELRPDVVLMDIGLQGLDGIAATRQILDALPSAKIIVLTQHENREYVLPALRAGASGYILKRSEGDELVTAIRAVKAGGTFLDPVIAGIVADMQRDGRAADPLDSLSGREREVMLLLAQGQTYQQAGRALFISAKTVGFHRANILRKLGLEGRADLTRYAAKRGLIS